MNLRLTTSRLFLRPLEIRDAAGMFAYRSLPEVWRYQFWCPADEAEIRAYIRGQSALMPGTPGAWYSLAIVSRAEERMIGDIGAHVSADAPAEVEIGITLSPAFQKRGYALEALREMFRYLFDAMGMERITASADPRNSASIRLLERAGMRRVADFPGRWVIRGERVDDAVFSIPREAFLVRKQADGPDSR
ncbi:MAG: GNAT family N-acetyltransferase [Anaerolineales bacterium]|nr:GNAT family N-acetyltransferase [Anaerolineales bacterium]